MMVTETLDERMRSVEKIAIDSTGESAIDERFDEARRNADLTLSMMRETYEGAGARIDCLSATIRPHETAFRSEVTMSQDAADKVFGKPVPTQQRQMPQRWRRRNQVTPLSISDHSGSETVSQFAELLREQLRRPSLPQWMHEVVRLDGEDHADAALEELFDQIDSLLSSGEFAKVDDIFPAMPVEGPSLTLMMGLLSITRPASEHLPSRNRYFERVYRLCKAMRRDAESLLGGLR